ncbi:MAG: hypothetical protein IPK17_17590 [Chloroflexi bacterium]|uniref:hypothetical protein n=1 Tax=Candidatus Flexifilum breve TaxID=3140694 RepID=UPI0031364AA4|nr:hypothetical protein [Chloroflexota bacterium]
MTTALVDHSKPPRLQPSVSNSSTEIDLNNIPDEVLTHEQQEAQKEANARSAIAFREVMGQLTGMLRARQAEQKRAQEQQEFELELKAERAAEATIGFVVGLFPGIMLGIDLHQRFGEWWITLHCGLAQWHRRSRTPLSSPGMTTATIREATALPPCTV